MTARLMRRAAAIGFSVLVVAFVVAFVYGFATSSDVRVPGAMLTVREPPGESLSADFEVEPIEALAVWLVLSVVAFVALRLLSAHRRST